MKDYSEILTKVEKEVQVITDENLRKIAFERLLEHELAMNSNDVGNVGTNTHTPNTATDLIKKKSIKKKSTFKGPFNLDLVREDVKAAFKELSAKTPGLKPFNSLKQKFEKFLWVLEIGRQKGITAMTNNEIAYVLSEKLAQSVTEKQVNNLKQKIKDGMVQVWEHDGKKAWKIVQDGILLVADNELAS